MISICQKTTLKNTLQNQSADLLHVLYRRNKMFFFGIEEGKNILVLTFSVQHGKIRKWRQDFK